MRGLGRLAGLGLVLLAARSPAAPFPVEGPVAVMPFKNLNQDASLEWLRLGIAETLLSDLRTSGRVRVVEREQLDRALTELALQEVRGTEESTAARAGKLVGARTVVLGSYQRAGKQVRLNARFVAVETGLVLGTAKVTGPLEGIFALQDGLVARLLGEEGATPRPPRRTGPRVVRAYELYGRALANPSPAERVGLLREAVKEEPGFTYAREDLERLEARLREHRRATEVASHGKLEELRATFCDAARPAEVRESAAYQFLIQRDTARHWWALLREAEAMARLGLPGRSSDSVRGYALRFLALAHAGLRHRELAIQVNERLLLELPGSTHAPVAQLEVSRLLAELREMQRGREAFAATLAQKEDAFTKHSHEPFWAPPGPDQLRPLERDRCRLRVEHFQFEESLPMCRAFIERWGEHTDYNTLVDVVVARRLEAIALAELGRFSEARARVEELDAFFTAHPLISGQRGIANGVRGLLPADEEGPGEPLCPSGHAPPENGPGPARTAPGKTPREG